MSQPAGSCYTQDFRSAGIWDGGSKLGKVSINAKCDPLAIKKNSLTVHIHDKNIFTYLTRVKLLFGNN